MIFMDSTKRTNPILTSLTSWATFKSSTAILWGYDDITLKLYIDISKTGEVTKLVKKGRIDSEKCLDAWEELIKRQEKEIGTNNFGAYFSLHKAYLNYANDHEVIRATLVLVGLSTRQAYNSEGKLVWINLIRPNDLVWLRSKGHNIDLTSYDTVLSSVMACIHKNENLITKAVSKRKELEKMLEGKGDGKPLEFVDIMAQLNFAWPNPVSDDITLATYNSYQKILKARLKAQEQEHARRNNR